jgi:uncharacterized protein YjlB
MSVALLASVKVSRHLVPHHGRLPNTSIQQRPLLIYRGVFPTTTATTADTIEAHLNTIGVVVPRWRYTMYDITHFHSTTHEVLCVVHGCAQLCFGGEENPALVEPVVRKGELDDGDSNGDGKSTRTDDGDSNSGGRGTGAGKGAETGSFEMVGAYPEGKAWDMCYGRDGEEDRAKGIAQPTWFTKDPIYGRGRTRSERRWGVGREMNEARVKEQEE